MAPTWLGLSCVVRVPTFTLDLGAHEAESERGRAFLLGLGACWGGFCP